MIPRFFAFVIVVLQVIVITHGTHLDDLRELCKSGKAPIKTISGLKSLFNALNDVLPTQTTGCSDHTGNALRDMYRIAADRNACTMEKARDLEKFVASYLRSGDQVGKSLPKPLVRFAIAYGMQVSNICMKRMIYAFSYKAFYKLLSLSAAEFNLITRIAHKNSPIDRMLAPIVKNGEIVLPSDLFGALPGLEKRFALYLTKRDPLKQLAEICTKKLRPFYEPILRPMAILTRLGFNYRDFWLRKDDFFNGKTLNKRGRFWSSVVFFCESIRSVAIIEQEKSDPNEELIDIELEVSKAKPGESLEALAAAALPETNDEEAREEEEDEEEEEEVVAAAAAMVGHAHEFPGNFLVPDEIVANKIMPGHFDYSLKSMVNSFDLNQNAIERLQARILNRGLRVFKSLFRLGQYKPLLKRMVKSLLFRRGSHDNNKELDEASFQEARESLLYLIETDEDVKSPLWVRTGELVGKVGQIPFKVILLLLRLVTSYTITLLLIDSFEGRKKMIDYRNKFEDIY